MSNIPYTALAVTLLFSVPAAADDTRNSSPTPRQMAHCMMARVKISPNENYKTAFKACRQQFESTPGEARQTAMDAMNNADTANNPKH